MVCLFRVPCGGSMEARQEEAARERAELLGMRAQKGEWGVCQQPRAF